MWGPNLLCSEAFNKVSECLDCEDIKIQKFVTLSTTDFVLQVHA